MIKTYVFNRPMNNVSHILTGKGGNTARFNFVNGNVITKKLPEITLRGKYYQELLEDSDLFRKGLVKLVRTVEEPADLLQPSEPNTPSAEDEKNIIEIPSVTSEAELVAFVNDKDNREGARMFKTVSSALDWASKNNYKFPNYQP